MSPRPEVAVGAIVRSGGEVLLIRRAQEPEVGRWSVPGGRVESGESIAEAVERETFEETGLRVRCGPFVGVAEKLGPAHHFVILDYEAELEGGDAPEAGSDAGEVAWVRLEDLDQLPLVAGLADFFREHGIIPPTPV